MEVSDVLIFESDNYLHLTILRLLVVVLPQMKKMKADLSRTERDVSDNR